MGRPAKPTALKVVKGERKDRINWAEPVPPSGEVVPPAWLEGDEVAMGEWARLAPDLVRQKVLTCWDTEEFADWCSAVARVARAEARLREEGAVVEQAVFDRNGVMTGHRRVRNPWSFELKDALAIKGRRGARFGLTPSDRSNISREAADVRKGDDLLTG